MTSKELRRKFIDYFVSKGHKELPAASLIPENDPSVLFTTAGMQQFKRFYTHPDEAPRNMVVTCQPCFRTSDIEEVGDDTHLTFFEMLGNFSFGGYFKKEAIEWGYEFLIKELGIKSNRIWCSIFSGDEINPRDNESAIILESMELKFKEHGREDNFWGPTGDEGPCGPTVEFYVDGIEVWNLVFNEYHQNSDGSYRKLDTPGVDTGMGLERMLVVSNNKNDVYETDVFEPAIKEIEKISLKKYNDDKKEFRIIADHLKAAVFLINDGILPSNKEQGYIIRRLIRRAIVQSFRLNINRNFLSLMTSKVFEIYWMYDFNKKIIETVFDDEERKFGANLKAAILEIDSYEKHKPMKVSGFELFSLYQSRGLPLEIGLEEVKRKDIQLEENYLEEFNSLLKEHQELSRTSSAGMFKGGLAGGGEKETKFHTATHLLLASLREILGKDVNQKGANITAERIRFDFNYPEKLTNEQIKKIEDWVNDKIAQNIDVQMEEMPLSQALESGATSIPGFNYPDNVKVFSIGDISREICGGPHVKNTSELGKFKIVKEESSSAGIRRIKAILK